MTAHAGLLNVASGFVEIQRTPTTFKAVNLGVAPSGTVTIWTPAAGKRFRVLGFDMTITPDATLAAAGVVSFIIQDSVGAFLYRSQVWLPNAAAPLVGSNNIKIGPWYPGGNGALGSSPGTTVQIVIGTALTAGTVCANVWGCEE